MDGEESPDQGFGGFSGIKLGIAIILCLLVVGFLGSIWIAFTAGYGPRSNHPQAVFEWNESGDGRIEMVHDGGEGLPIANLSILVKLEGSSKTQYVSNSPEYTTAVYENNFNGVLEEGESIQVRNISSKVDSISLIWKAGSDDPARLTEWELQSRTATSSPETAR